MIKAISIGARAKDKAVKHCMEIHVEFAEPCTQSEAEEIVMTAIGNLLFEKESKCETNEVETTIKPPEAIYEGFNSHDCETWYKCPVCDKKFGSWSLPSGAKIANCPYCGTELQF